MAKTVTYNEAASKTVDIAGDGTTTAVVLAQAIVNEGFKNIIASANLFSILSCTTLLNSRAPYTGL